MVVIFLATILHSNGILSASAEAFQHLSPALTPKILAAAEAFPGGNYNAENTLQPSPLTGSRPEYASNGKGVATFVDFDLGQPMRLGGFRHVQRSTIDTVSEARLLFSNTPDFKNPLATVRVKHVDIPGATTFAGFAPVTARYVRWQVTAITPGRSPNVGGQRIEWFVAGEAEAAPHGIGIETRTAHVIERKAGPLTRSMKLTLDYPYAEPVRATVRIEGQQSRSVDLKFGKQTLDYTIAAAETSQTLNVAVDVGGETVASRAVTIEPARTLTVYLLPHSHNDIGYTAIQTDIEEKQINNLLEGMAAARRTADYPAGARFVWNVEVLWGADLFLQRLSAKQRAEFVAAVRCGQVALNGMYLNELTGLCRPEELVRLFRYSTELGRRCSTTVDSAMISDVPGYTWGTVTAMAQAGIRYFSVAPNYFDRIGTIMVEWENKPFWWIGPDGKSKVLVWIPFWGYAMSHRYGRMSPDLVADFCDGLQNRSYPYDIAYARWAGHGDNAVPDPAICDFVKQWNETHASPRFVISSTSEAFRAFEKHYGDKLPEVRGDWTPYWEDGAGSSAAETAMNRASSDRLAQAETLWAMLNPSAYPKVAFEDAWRNVLLYSEHTWGAWCSISDPANSFTTDQWTIKQSFATRANLQSQQLLSAAAQTGLGFQAPAVPGAGSASQPRFDVFNTSSWARTGLALLPHELSEAGDRATDERGRPVASQRLASGELAVLIRDRPPFASRRYTITKEPPLAEGQASAIGRVLDNHELRASVDPQTGGIVELRAVGIDVNLADTASGHAINDYLYLLGDDPAALQKNGPVKISVRDRGPLVASLLVESDAPGCHHLSRELRITAGGDYVELMDTVDKKRLAAKSYYAPDGKESVHFAFPFHVPGGRIRLDVPFGLVRPELDQMPSACKNWLTVSRWADVANADFGVTWVTLDAPLVEIGGITATLLNSQTNPAVWRKKIEPTQKLYSWAMNNHWGTNYRAFQEGPVRFRFVLRPHRAVTAADTTRFATSFSQPLVAVPARGSNPPGNSLLRVEPAAAIATALKPADEGQALIVRLFNADDKPASVKLIWDKSAAKQIWLSDTSERPVQEAPETIEMPASGLVTLRAEMR
jgi:hypothetical protein